MGKTLGFANRIFVNCEVLEPVLRRTLAYLIRMGHDRGPLNRRMAASETRRKRDLD